MQLTPSAHVDTFCRDNLPPDELWPELRFTLPGLQYPARLNAAAALVDATAEASGGRPCLMSPDVTWSYADVRRISSQVARVFAERFPRPGGYTSRRIARNSIGRVFRRSAAPVLDLGCGRGEFLEMLRDAGVGSARHRT